MKAEQPQDKQDTLNEPGGKLKVFFSYANGAGATSAMAEEARHLEGAGFKVITSILRAPGSGQPEGEPFNLQEILNANPDLVALDDIGVDNDAHARNKHRYQDVEELIRAGITVYATMTVGNLESEADRFEEITGAEPAFRIPDRFFYTCDQLEFVDIDPEELIERQKARGLARFDVATLKELRALALHCVAEYTLSSSQSEKRHRLHRSVEEKVLAIISLDGTADTVVHEAARISEALDAEFQCLFVETAPKDSAAAERDNEVLAQLGDLIETLGGTLVVLNSEDPIGLTSDYVHTHGITDIVMARRPITAYRRLLLPLSLPLDDRLAAQVPNVHIHTVPTVRSNKKYRVTNPKYKKTAFTLSFKDLLFTVIVVALASVFIYLLSNVGFSNQTSVLVYILAAAVVARMTKGYIPGILASVLATLSMSYFFVRPYFSFAVDHKGNYVTFIIMLVVSIIITTLATRMQRESERARYREQHTQVLYDLNKSMLFTRGVHDVISTALDTVTRLFDRAAIFYTGDPFGTNTSKTRPSQSDANITIFDSPTEKEAAAWVFENNAPAGFGTDTFAITDGMYLPLFAGDEVRGVLGLSMRLGEISQDELTFLDMVTSQIALALERQHLFDEHREDLRAAELDSVRARFAVTVADYADSSAGLISIASRRLLGLSAEDKERFSKITDFLAQETHREKSFTEALSAMLTDNEDEEDASDSSVDVAEIVRQAVEEVREQEPHVIIDFDARSKEADVLVERELVKTAVTNLLAYSASRSPKDSIVQVAIKVHPHAVDISIADDREKLGTMLNKSLSSRYMTEREVRITEMLDMSLDELEALEAKEAAQSKDGEKLKKAEMLANEEHEINLTIAGAAIRAHDGRVSIRKRLGGGAVTSIWLPR